MSNSPHQEISSVEDQVLPLRTRNNLYTQEVAPAGSQKLRAQDSLLARRCGPERNTGHQGREGGNGAGNRDGSGDGNEGEDGNGHEGRDESENGSENGDEI